MKKTPYIISLILAMASLVSTEKAEARTSFEAYNKNAAHQLINNISNQGTRIQLGDGSHWQIPENAYYTMINWRPGDVIRISPNHLYFSEYNYTIENLSTNTHVVANLSIGPIVDSVYTHWVTGINYATAQVVLEDESVWKIWDTGDLKNWALHDTIIIGVYNSWFSSYNKILINASLDFNTYLRAKQN
jgi:hypothetical protein